MLNFINQNFSYPLFYPTNWIALSYFICLFLITGTNETHRFFFLFVFVFLNFILFLNFT